MRNWDFSYGGKDKALKKCYLRGGEKLEEKIFYCQNVLTFICSALDLKLGYIQYPFLAKMSVYCEKAF